MKRSNFIFSAFSIIPAGAFSKLFHKTKWRTGKGFKVNAGEGRNGGKYHMKGVTVNILDVKISAKDTDGDLSVFEQTGRTPESGPPMHVHPYQDEVCYVIDGKYRFAVGDDTYTVNKGDTVFLPREVPHTFIQLTTTCKMVVIYQPAGKMEGFFSTTASWTKSPSQEEIKKAFEEADMKIVGPPLKVD